MRRTNSANPKWNPDNRYLKNGEILAILKAAFANPAEATKKARAAGLPQDDLDELTEVLAKGAQSWEKGLYRYEYLDTLLRDRCLEIWGGEIYEGFLRRRSYIDAWAELERTANALDAAEKAFKAAKAKFAQISKSPAR